MPLIKRNEDMLKLSLVEKANSAPVHVLQKVEFGMDLFSKTKRIRVQ